MAAGSSASPETELRRAVLRAVALYLALVAANVGLIAYLVLHDLDQRQLEGRLVEAHEAARQLAEEIRRRAPPGGLDYVQVIEQQGAIARLVDEARARVTFLDQVRIVDPHGRILFERQRTDRTEEIPIGADTPPDPDSPPLERFFTQPEVSDRLRSGEPVPVLMQPRYRTIEVPLDEAGRLLMLDLIVDPQTLDQMQRGMLSRLVLGGIVSLLLLSVAFLYVLRLVHRTRHLEADSQKAKQLAYLGTLASGLAHEIRNPLNAMGINLQMLEEELGSGTVDEETLQLLRSSRSEVERLERLVKDFLAFARPQESERVLVSSSDLAADVVRFVRPEFDRHGIRLEFEDLGGAPAVLVDAGQIRQALLNILQNAREASPEGGVVRVSVGGSPRGEAEIRISDSGPGIEEDARERIFEVFYSGKPAGSGLGLPIAKRLIEFHDGRIEIDSRPGAGSTFRILLPPALAETAEAQANGSIAARDS